MDPGMNSLLKWSIENSEASEPFDPNAAKPADRRLRPEALSQLLGGPSDADLMKASMAAVRSPDITLDNKLVAFDNFEQLIEQIDNANNMENLGLWTPLVELLEDEESELRRMAAWCVGTAVQNNVRAQQRLLILGGIPKLVKMAVEDENMAVRKKSVYALSSAVRNYQPAMDEAVKHLPNDFTSGKIDGKNMGAVDVVMDKLREQIS